MMAQKTLKKACKTISGLYQRNHHSFTAGSSTPIKIVFAIWLILVLPAMAYADLHTAKSCSVSDVQDAVNAATYGDTVKIPRGNCTWTSGITISKDIHIVGEGADSTILNAGFPDDRALQAFFTFVPDATARANLSSLSNTNLFEVSGITFAGPSPRLPFKFGVWVYNIYTPSIRRVRIHNNKFISIHRAVQVKGYVHGVFDSNDLIDTNGSYPQGVGLAMFTNDVMTTGSGDGWYIEDNTFSFSSVGCVSGAANDGYGHIVRYNTVAGKLDFYVESHSNQLAYIKGGFFTEVYGNDFSASTKQGGIDMRGGKNIIFSNKITNASPRVREEFEDAASGALPPNMAPSTRPQICTDDNVCWKVNHSYFWNNRQSTTNAIVPFFIAYDRYDNVNDNYPPELVENREFWNQRPTGIFDGSGGPDNGGGVGCGTLDQMYNIRPTTEGVGFWVTNQSCSNMNGMIGANPATPLEGTLYRNVNGTWTAYYTPYIYPHPLRGAVTAVYATSETQSIESQTTETYEPQSTQSSESESTEPNELLTADTDETQQAETAEPSPSATPPNAPSNLVASAINFSKILLSWSDNSNNEEGFKIEQCTDSACGKASLFATTPANTNQCSANRSVNVEYYYRVRAYNSSGDSGYTNIVGIDGKKVSRR